MTRKTISIVFITLLSFGLTACNDNSETSTNTESSATVDASSSSGPSSTGTTSNVTITNDGLTPEGSPVVTVTTNVKIDLIVGAPETDSEPVQQKPGTQSYPLYPAPELGESVTWVVVALDHDTKDVLKSETFTWTREE